MKNRKNDNKSPQNAPSSNQLGDPKRILFICDRLETQLAQILFDSEARKMEVYWIASSRCFNADEFVLPEQSQLIGSIEKIRELGIDADSITIEVPDTVTPEDFKTADLVVAIQHSDSHDFNNSIEKMFASLTVEKEIWKLSQDGEPVDVLLQNIKALMVRLIMKGGKRAPVPVQVSTAKQSPVPSGAKSAVRVRLESKGRGGKKVTVIFGLELELAELEKLAAELKQTCGSGGTVKDDTIEIQGDQCNRVLSEMQRRGYKAKRSGG